MNEKEFLDKLDTLLKEYGASIMWQCGEGSDTYGIYDSHLIITIDNVIVYSADDDYICTIVE